jgi:hypothetical protein
MLSRASNRVNGLKVAVPWSVGTTGPLPTRVLDPDLGRRHRDDEKGTRKAPDSCGSSDPAAS